MLEKGLEKKGEIDQHLPTLRHVALALLYCWLNGSEFCKSVFFINHDYYYIEALN